MKKLSFLALAAVGLLLGACSSDKDVDQNGQEGRDGKGYLSVQINLPTIPATATRALNDVYDDGLAAEYKVNNALLLLFHNATPGDPEANATFWQAVELTIPEVKDYDDDNITSSYMSVAEVADTYTKDLWALVLINYSGVFNLSTLTFMGKDGSLGVDKALIAGTTTIADLQKAVFANPFIDNVTGSGFFMTNAVLTSDEGGKSGATPAKGNLSVLAKLADDCIKDTEAEAKANPAGSVFVERAVAKATLSVATGATFIGTTNDPTDPDYLGLNITDVKWGLNNTETSSYLVRNMFFDEGKGTGTLLDDYMGYSSEAFTPDDYRFAGSVKIGKTAIQPTVNLYRTYWCCDPQYSKDATLNYATTTYGETGVEKPQYCYENTFDVLRQSYNNTTRAIIKVTTDGGDFYTVNGKEELYTQADAETEILKIIIDDANIQKAFKDNKTSAGDYTVDKTSFDLTVADLFTRDPSTGQWKIDGAKLTYNPSTVLAADFDLTNLATDLSAAATTAAATANAYVTVLKYVGGVMYYEARFQHFADNATAANDLAPWNTWEITNKPAVGGTSASYPANTKTAEENYLGRYGMVRNNWYDVQVTAFAKIGKPVDPSATISTDPTPDDNVNKKYISVKVNVLSWAKRTQRWSF